MRVYSSDRFVLPLPEGHAFPMEKYRLLRKAVEADGIRPRDPPAATWRALARVHRPSYLTRVAEGRLSPREERRIGFPWSPAMVERSRRSVGATAAAARAALEDGIAINLAGGTHHAFPDRGEGFCVFNDVAVVARGLLVGRRVGRIAVVDLDVHQGNGTAAIFAADRRVFTASVHGAGNYPFEKEASDFDVALVDGVADGPYLAAVDDALDAALARSPDLVFYVSGADPYSADRWGRLAVSAAGLAERDRRVLEACRARAVPVVVTMGGGYAPDVGAIAAIHHATVRAAASAWRRASVVG